MVLSLPLPPHHSLSIPRPPHDGLIYPPPSASWFYQSHSLHIMVLSLPPSLHIMVLSSSLSKHSLMPNLSIRILFFCDLFSFLLYNMLYTKTSLKGLILLLEQG